MKQNEHISFRTYVQAASSATRPVCEPHAIVATQAAVPPAESPPAQNSLTAQISSAKSPAHTHSGSSGAEALVWPHAGTQAAAPESRSAPAQAWPAVQSALEAVPIHLGWVVGLWEFEAGGVTNIQGFRSHDDKYI